MAFECLTLSGFLWFAQDFTLVTHRLARTLNFLWCSRPLKVKRTSGGLLPRPTSQLVSISSAHRRDYICVHRCRCLKLSVRCENDSHFTACRRAFHAREDPLATHRRLRLPRVGTRWLASLTQCLIFSRFPVRMEVKSL